MIVAIDVTTLRGHISGVGYYTARIVDFLSTRVGIDVDRLLLLSNRAVDRAVPQNATVIRALPFPIRSVWMQLMLPIVLRRTKPGITHFTNYLAPAAGAGRYVVSVHDMSLTRTPEHHTLKKRLLTASLVPRIARASKLVLTPSEATSRDVVDDLGIDAGRVVSIPYAAAEMFRPSLTPPDDPRLRAPYFLFVGTIEPRKNLVRLLDAFAAFCKENPTVVLVLAGQRGWKCEEIYARAAAPDIARRVVVLDYVNEATLPSLYTHALACVYPSLFEGFGFPVVEAMACGAPVLTSRTTSLGEVGRGAALLIDPLDTSAIRDGLMRLASDPSLRADLRAKGLARAASYSWDETGRRTLAAYRKALDC
jgi:glycosyltransferase involved in cell wall biosynthesis